MEIYLNRSSGVLTLSSFEEFAAPWIKRPSIPAWAVALLHTFPKRPRVMTGSGPAIYLAAIAEASPRNTSQQAETYIISGVKKEKGEEIRDYLCSDTIPPLEVSGGCDVLIY
jgi:hypothetical protein